MRRLGVVQSVVGPPEQRRRCVGRFADRQADARTERDGRPPLARGEDCVPDPSGSHECILGGRHRIEHDDELVATDPGRQVVPADRAADLRRDLEQQLIPGAVPEGVVDLLEPIEIDEAQADAFAAAHRAGQGVG